MNWINPSPQGDDGDVAADKIYKINESLVLQWTTNYPTYTVFLMQQEELVNPPTAGIGSGIYGRNMPSYTDFRLIC